jgi:uncharacterized membrane protein
MWVLRTFMLLALIVWIGGIIFFAFVLAPTLFTVLPNTQLAGAVVSPALTKLHWMGLISGAVFLLASVIYNWRKYLQLRLFTATHVLMVLMLALTAISQFAITPRMRFLRAGPLSMDTMAAHAEFDSLHAWSTRSEGAVLLLGLVVTVLTARRMGETSR